MRILKLLPFLLLATSCAERTSVPGEETAPLPADAMAQYRSLIGFWVDSTTSADYTTYERWTSGGDSVLNGFGYVLQDADTVFIEDLRISAMGSGVAYSARIATQNNGEWVPFMAQATGPDTLMFENALHDFPQCITYTRSGEGWEVSVTGTDKGEEHAELFRLMPM
ncbi:MAG TPA: DUF6265 family protein [Flavobacteriales bacterium]|nr:DUF6265 family protein [Flavobacteriales bacterium]